MYCENCGAKISAHAKFCRNCGAVVTGGSTDDVTRVLSDDQATSANPDDLTKTRVMPQADRRQTAPTDPAPQYSSRDDAPIPTLYGPPAYEDPRRSPVLPIVIALLVVGVVGALLALNTCNKPASTTPEATKQEQPEATQDKKTEQTEQTTDASASTSNASTDDGAVVSPSGRRANGEEDAATNVQTVDQATLDAWSQSARSLMAFYPANHILAGGDTEDPSQMSIDDWANNCLRFVDQTSSLGQALLNDPESVAAPLGYYDAASYVSSTEVTGASAGGINVVVTLEATQMDWDNTSTITEEFLVQFNNDGLVTDIVSVG